jgi:Helix-turn-helix domain
MSVSCPRCPPTFPLKSSKLSGHVRKRAWLIMEAAAVPRKAWTIAQFCESYGFSKSFVHNEIRRGKLKAHKTGRATRILDEDRLGYLATWREIKPKPAVNAPKCILKEKEAQL